MNQLTNHQSTLSSVLCCLLSTLSYRPSTSVENALQIDPFMQNKANFLKSQMNVYPYNTTVYENKSNWTLGENKPNQTQFQRQKNAGFRTIVPSRVGKGNKKVHKSKSAYQPCQSHGSAGSELKLEDRAFR